MITIIRFFGVNWLDVTLAVDWAVKPQHKIQTLVLSKEMRKTWKTFSCIPDKEIGGFRLG